MSYKIYLITNQVNGKKYVGQTKLTLGQRMSGHKSPNVKTILNAAIKKHGTCNFTIKLIKECSSIEEARIDEARYIQQYDTLFPKGYNMTIDTDRKEFSEQSKKLNRQKWNKKRYEYRDEFYTVYELHEQFCHQSVSIRQLYTRLHLGWDVAEAVETHLKIAKTYEYKSQPIEWKELIKLRHDSLTPANIRSRLILGWSAERAISEPLSYRDIKERKYCYKDKEYLITDLIKFCKPTVSLSILKSRILNGWSIKDAVELDKGTQRCFVDK
jgi:group I intron endonuclease